jgi:predicted GH43/DUF377 family glycosyl hydrolase
VRKSHGRKNRALRGKSDRLAGEVGSADAQCVQSRRAVRGRALLPVRADGRFALLRRPIGFVDTDTGHGEEHPSIRISFSDDLKTWTNPEIVIRPEFGWEENRIGVSAPPVRTAHGWLTLYHGVQTVHAPTRRVIYRLGAMLLDPADPRRVIARAPDFIMEPEAYYEKFGLFVPNVIFPTGAVVKDGLLWIYYGCCDTAIGLATVPLEELVEFILATGRAQPHPGRIKPF